VARIGQVIQIDEDKIEAHLGDGVRSMGEETLNALLDAETSSSGSRLSGVPHFAGILRYL
jgi:hypothetical protein